MSVELRPDASLRRRRACGLLPALVVLAGCAVGPRYTGPAPSEMPAQYPALDAGLTGQPATDRWWELLADPVLTALIDAALADNPDLAAAEARVRQSRAFARAAGAGYLPALGASGRISRDKLSLNGENLALIPITPPVTAFTDYRIGLDAAWEIDLAGHTRRQVEAAVARFGSRTETRNDARVVVAAEVASGYVDYRVATARLALARQLLAALDDSARLVRLQQQAGLASESDLRAADAERLSSAGLPATLEATRLAAQLRLAALTGQPAAGLAARLEADGAIPLVPAESPVGLPAELLRRRPDIRGAERELAAATADVGVAVAAQFPRFSLVGDAGFDSVRFGDLTSAASRFWNFGPQLTLPLFAGGQLRRQAEAAKAARDAAVAIYRGTVLRAIAEAETAVVRFAASRRDAAGLGAAAGQLADRAGLERLRYDAGDISRLEVLLAERSANRAADLRAESAGRLALDFVALQKALGGGWQTAAAR